MGLKAGKESVSDRRFINDGIPARLATMSKGSGLANENAGIPEGNRTCRYGNVAARLVWSEQEHYKAPQAKLAALGAEITDTHERIAWLQANPDLDDDLQSTAMYWESYFGPEKEAFHADAEKRDLEALIAARRFSTDAQCGNILQYAKQGISLVHRGFKSCSDGRHIGTLHVKNVIWQSRNQAIHWTRADSRNRCSTSSRHWRRI